MYVHEAVVVVVVVAVDLQYACYSVPKTIDILFFISFQFLFFLLLSTAFITFPLQNLKNLYVINVICLI